MPARSPASCLTTCGMRRTSAARALEVAVRTFTLPSGQTVDLIGVVHIADAGYYQELNQRFAGL